MSDQPVTPPEEETPPIWYKPGNALSDEEVAALAKSTEADAETSATELPNSTPTVEGGWYTPPNAITTGDLNVLNQDVIAGIQAAPTTAAELGVGDFSLEEIPPLEPELDVEPEVVADEAEDEPEPEIAAQVNAVPAPEGLDIEGELRDAPSAPVAFGQGDFVEAPEAPVDEPHEEGLGGLRDEYQGLDPAAVRAEEPVIQPIVPAKGFGGVADAAGTGTSSQDTRNLSETGTMGDQTPPPNATGAVPPQFSAQPVPQAPIAQQPYTPGVPTPAPTPPPNPVAEKFRSVEQNVAGLREQYQKGMMSRPQLEAELRKLIVLDEQGRWWTMGVESNRWYRYDGREWVPDTPPQTGSAPAAPNVRGNYVPTETSVPMPAVEFQPPRSIELDAYGMPLPQRVPVVDPSATMVNLNSATAEPTTLSPAVGEPTIPSPMSIDNEMTMPSSSVAYGEATLAGATIAGAPAQGGASPAIEHPVAAKKAGIQPDYSEAYKRSMDRATVTKTAVWVGVGGVVISLGMVLCVLLGLVGYYFSVVNKYQDRLDNLGQRASTFQTTQIFDAQGNVIAEYNDPNTGARTQVPLEEISPFVIHATIATEDETFYENPGFSVYAILRAVYTNVRAEGPRSGASTITQQLARATILDEDFAAEVSATRKIDEIILAAELSRRYDKNEILTLYLNEIYYGNLAYGIEAAAQVYFGKSAAELNVFESALLAGLPQAPAIYDPVRNREGALGRMLTVIQLMTEANGNGCIKMQHTNATYDLTQPEGFCVTQDYLNGSVDANVVLQRSIVETTIFQPQDFQPRYAHFATWVWSQVEEDYNASQIYSTGFRIYTTLDPTIQDTAQQAVTDQLASAQSRGIRINNGTVVVMDPRTGAVLAMVGSADFNNKEIDGQVNVAFSPQQPGSSIKPLVYLTTLEGREDGEYWTPATVIWDTPNSCWIAGAGSQYCPTNYDRAYHGPLPMRFALGNSYNIPAVKALDFIGLDRFEKRAAELGLNFPLQSPTEAGLSSALGGFEIRLFDLVAVYSTFANGGQRFVPYGITRIETANGDVIFEASPEPYGLNINPAHAYQINSMLADDNARSAAFGRGTIMTIPGHEVAVKTGTTNNNRDLLAIGWSPQVIVGVWMGNTDDSETSPNESGFTTAVPVWNRVITAALQGQPNQPFARPDTIQGIQVCWDTGAMPPDAGCGPGGTNPEFFYAGNPPPEAGDGILEVIQVDPFTNRRANQFCAGYAIEKTFLRIEDQTAIDWMRNTPQGQAWAQERQIDSNLGAAPTEECQEGQSVPEVLITQPGAQATVQGFVSITGIATVPNFAYYELAYASAFDPNTFITIPANHADVENRTDGALTEWDTRSLANGTYTLRLSVFSATGAKAERTVTVNVQNVSAVPTDVIQPTGIFVPTDIFVPTSTADGLVITPAPEFPQQ